MTRSHALRLLLAFLLLPAAAGADDRPAGSESTSDAEYDEYRKGQAVIVESFDAVHRAYGGHMRLAAILQGCGSKELGRLLETETKNAASDEFVAAMKRQVADERIASAISVYVAGEGMQRMMDGYALGVEEATKLLMEGIANNPAAKKGICTTAERNGWELLARLRKRPE